MLADAPWMAQAVQALALELRLHHAPTAEHSHRLAAHARLVAERLCASTRSTRPRSSSWPCCTTSASSRSIPTSSTGRARSTTRQRERMRRHTIEGEELLAGIAGLEHLAPAVRATHEAWDGTGYPDGLAGDDIPLTARIVTVVDAFDAMTSERAYRRPLPRREALRRLRAGAGMQFDPRVVDAIAARRSEPRGLPAARH